MPLQQVLGGSFHYFKLIVDHGCLVICRKLDVKRLITTPYGISYNFMMDWPNHVKFCIVINRYLLHTAVSNKTTHYLLFIFKPGACQPKASAWLVSWNCLCLQCEYVYVCPPLRAFMWMNPVWPVEQVLTELM